MFSQYNVTDGYFKNYDSLLRSGQTLEKNLYSAHIKKSILCLD